MKRCVGILLLLICVTEPGGAESSSPLAIIAETFPLVVEARSKNHQVYVFNDLNSHQAPIGRIILARRGGENAMAFRVIKTYNQGEKFAGSRIRRTYSGISELTVTDPLRAIEKVSDHFPARTAEEIKQDTQDLSEIESENPSLVPDSSAESPPEEFMADPAPGESSLDAMPQDPELDETFDEAPESSDSATAPPDQPLPDQTPPMVSAFDADLDRGTSPLPEQYGNNESENYLNQIVLEDKPQLDRDMHWMSFQASLLRNIGAEGTSEFFSGAGLRYGYTLKRSLLIKNSPYQDSLSLDSGLFIYKVLNYETESDAYTVVPFIANLRYNVHFNEGMGVFAYLGFVKNFVQSAFEGSELAVANLGSFLPSMGIGSFFRIGPHWFVRTDIGLDVVGAGLVLRF